MNSFLAKITNRKNVDLILNHQPFIHEDIYNFKNEIQIGSIVFFVFSGDKTQIDWEQGLIGFGKVTKAPYDEGYSASNPRYFRIEITPEQVLPKPIPPKNTKIHPYYAADLYDVPYVGANHFPNQAIAKADEKGTIALFKVFKEFSNLINAHNNSSAGSQLNKLVEQSQSDFSLAGLKVEDNLLLRMASSLLAKRFLILTGLSGSGKTKLAHAFASWFSPDAINSTPFYPGAKIDADRITYLVKSANQDSILFSNNEDSSQETLVMLPRELIQQWVDCIIANNFNRDNAAREIREKVSLNSKYSTQLNSFETHLKAAAFALIESGSLKHSHSFWRVIAVGADWTTNENILGYQDALQPDIYRKPSSGALDVILQAENDPTYPYFIILDEMNLSHVERYFADILSSIESGQKISLHSSSENLKSSEGDTLLIPPQISLPKNLFIIGTVNVDETTYMFSPKVLDRANVIEFRASAKDITEFLDSPASVHMEMLAGKGAAFAENFVSEAISEVNLETAILAQLKTNLAELFDALASIGAEFGYRTTHEVTRFIYFHKKLTENGWQFNEALDAQILQKLMPKLHGSQRRLGPVLKVLEDFCSANQCNTSLDKIHRMQDRLKDGFTSFAEA
jgi:hypothetical protein